MIITSVKKYKGSTYEVCIDDKKLYFHREIVADFNLKEMTEISGERLEELIKVSEKRRAMERALYLLDYREYSYRELFKKLSENYDEDTCFYIMDKLVSAGMINDRRYAENLARKYIESKKYGPYRALNEMRLKGLDRELIDEALEKYKENTVDMLYELVKKKYSGCVSDRDSLRKMKNALVRQGYGYDDINTVVHMLNYSDDE